MAAGNKHLDYKDTLNDLERRSPGTKADFYFGFLKRASDRFASDEPGDGLGLCQECGSPASGDLCAFCRLAERVAGAEAVPVELLRTRR